MASERSNKCSVLTKRGLVHAVTWGLYRWLVLALLLTGVVLSPQSAEADCTEPVFAWTRITLSDGNFVGPVGLAIDSSGDVIVSGNFIGSIDFDPSDAEDMRVSIGEGQFVSKFGPDGSYKWTYTLLEQEQDATSQSRVLAIDIGDQDEIYIVGEFNGTVDFDPTADEDVHTSVRDRDTFVTRLDSSGLHDWTETLDSSLEVGYIAYSAADGRVVVAGIDSPYRSFVFGVDSVGSLEWFEQFDGIYPSLVMGLSVDDNSNVTLVTQLAGSADLDPTDGVDLHPPESIRGYAVGLVRLGTDGSFRWARHLGNEGGRIGAADIQAAGDGHLWIVGYFGGTVDFDPQGGIDARISEGEINPYVCQLSETGELIRVQTLGDTAVSLRRVTVDSSGNPVFTGRRGNSDEPLDLDPTDGVDIHTPLFSNTAFVSKYYSYGWYGWSLMEELTPTSELIGIAVGPDDSVVCIGTVGGFNGSPNGMFVSKFNAVPLPPSLLATTPENDWVDARQDRSLSGRTAQGIDRVRMKFACRVRDLATGSPIGPESFSVSDTGDSTQIIFGVQAVDDIPNTYDILLADPIPPGEWTTIVANVATLDGTPPVEGVGDRTTVGFLPGDVNSDRKSSPGDILSLIDGLNGTANPPLGIHQCDLDRSDACNGADILRLVDLLNGVATTRAWVGVGLTGHP